MTDMQNFNHMAENKSLNLAECCHILKNISHYYHDESAEKLAEKKKTAKIV